jgi:hypothetical protein
MSILLCTSSSVEVKKARKVSGKPKVTATPSSAPTEPAIGGDGTLAPLAEERKTMADESEGPLCTSETKTVQLQQYSLITNQAILTEL